MTLFRGKNADSRTKAILRQLERERQLLLNGRLDDLRHVAARLDSLMEQLTHCAASSVNAGALASIRAAALRNAVLIEASRKGTLAARDRLGEIVDAQGRLGTYDGGGVRHDIAPLRLILEKRR